MKIYLEYPGFYKDLGISKLQPTIIMKNLCLKIILYASKTFLLMFIIGTNAKFEIMINEALSRADEGLSTKKGISE